MDVSETRDDFEKPMWIVKTPKAKTTYYVKKSNDGFAFWTISSSSQVPMKLRGLYTRYTDALKALTEHLEKAPESNTVRREEMAQRMIKSREENAAKTKPKRTSRVQQGSTD